MNRVDIELRDYRASILGPDGEIITVHDFKAINRGDAAKLAMHLVDRNAIELWECGQWIGTFEPDKRGGASRFRHLRVARLR